MLCYFKLVLLGKMTIILFSRNLSKDLFCRNVEPKPDCSFLSFFYLCPFETLVVHALREEYYMCACCTIDMNSRGSVTKVWGCDWVRNQQASQQQQGQQRDNKWYPSGILQ